MSNNKDKPADNNTATDNAAALKNKPTQERIEHYRRQFEEFSNGGDSDKFDGLKAAWNHTKTSRGWR